CDAKAARGETPLHFRLHLARQINFGEAYVAVLVALNVLKFGQLRRVEFFDETFGQNGQAERAARRASLDDCAFDDVADFGEGYGLATDELLADDRQRRARGLADAEREVSGLASHRDDAEPAFGRARVLHQILDKLDADVARGLIAEGRDVRRQRKVVVNRLRHVDDFDLVSGAF